MVFRARRLPQMAMNPIASYLLLLPPVVLESTSSTTVGASIAAYVYSALFLNAELDRCV
jgi:hypothetical protein